MAPNPRAKGRASLWLKKTILIRQLCEAKGKVQNTWHRAKRMTSEPVEPKAKASPWAKRVATYMLTMSGANGIQRPTEGQTIPVCEANGPNPTILRSHTPKRHSVSGASAGLFPKFATSGANGPPTRETEDRGDTWE